jgi:hypothetical protein
VIPALDLELAGHQRGRALRQAHAARRGQYFGTLIHHACDRCFAFAQLAIAFAQLAIAIAVVLTAAGRGLVRRTYFAELRRARRRATVIAAVGVPVVAAAADREQLLTTQASLEAKQQLAVHRSPTAATTNLPTAPTTSIVCSQPASIGRGPRAAYPGPSIFSASSPTTDPTATILAIATSRPTDLNRQNATGSRCHQQSAIRSR